MADRRGAETAGEIFDFLASLDGTESIGHIARKIYEQFALCDFHPAQMVADEACLKLGIARRGIDPEFPDDGYVTLWPGESGYEEAACNDEGWISVNEKLPAVNQWVLVFGRTATSLPHNNCWIAARLDDRFDGAWGLLIAGQLGKNVVTHWRHLPERPS